MTTSQSFTQKLKGKVTDLASAVVFKIATSNWNLAIPALLFVAVGQCAYRKPDKFTQPLTFDFKLPSEDRIPPFAPAPKFDGNDIRWRFRFAETGTEFRAGIPYWIFRIMPRLMPEKFGGQGYDWFGFDAEDKEFYESTPVPRGMSLSDSTLRIPFMNLRVRLKRVSINCSGCHRGGYLDESGNRKLIDGMPNHTANLQGFKQLYASGFQDPRFTGENVVAAINELLAESKTKLEPKEEAVYGVLVALLRGFTRERSSAWMDSRAPNGPGRIDPFNAVKFEVLKAEDDGTAATLDFPSVWNQRTAMRSWHHFDGNTQSSEARNFGSVIGVGGIAFSVNKHSVDQIGKWLDALPSPKYPFAAPSSDDVAKGLDSFKKRCATCHGLYDREKSTVSTVPTSQYMRISENIGTDGERARAFPPKVAALLSRFGFDHALWPDGAFRGTEGGYLCGPLDGIWARAPYLHNGSVPTLNDLLLPPEERPKTFYRGNPAYDTVNMGWVHTKESGKNGAAPLFEYDTRLLGNSNDGHAITVEDPVERAALLAYLKTL